MKLGKGRGHGGEGAERERVCVSLTLIQCRVSIQCDVSSSNSCFEMTSISRFCFRSGRN